MDSLSIVFRCFLCFYIIHSWCLEFSDGLEDRQGPAGGSRSLVVKLRGLPWSATEDDVVNFLGDCNIKNGTHGVHLIMTKEGRPSGVAYVELESEDDLDLAYKMDGRYLGDRYVEVFPAHVSEMQRTLRRSEQSIHRALTDACVRIRGLPYKTSEHDVFNFFEGLEIVPNGVHLVYDGRGRTTGEAYVQFKDQKEAEKALQRSGDRLYHRSSLGEMRLAHLKQHYTNQVAAMPPDRETDVNQYGGYQMLRPLRFSNYPERYNGGELNRGRDTWYDQNNGGQPQSGNMRYQQNNHVSEYKLYALRMRGLPYDATRQDIIEFFSPLKPVEIDIHFNSRGKATGQADVAFKTQEDLEKAMAKNNQYMKHRYVELFQ